MCNFCDLFKVFADLAVDQYQILMATVAAALQEIGYLIEVLSNLNLLVKHSMNNIRSKYSRVVFIEHVCLLVCYNFCAVLI